MSRVPASAVLAAVVLAAMTVPAGQRSGKITTAPPTTGTTAGDPAGAFESMGSGAKPSPESSQVSLDAVAATPARYDGKTLARHVALGGMRPAGGAVAVAARDAATGKRIDADPDAKFYLVVPKALAERIDAEGKTDAVITFTVTKLPIPDRESFVGAIFRVELVGPNGGAAKTLEAE